MSSGVRPSSDKPAEDYYFQPWWAKEFIRIVEIMEKADLARLSEKDTKAMTKAAASLAKMFPERH